MQHSDFPPHEDLTPDHNGAASWPAPKLYGRSRGRNWGARHDHLMDKVYPPLAITLDQAQDPKALFASPPEQVWLEIGFGGGEHLVQLAERHPTYGYLGAESYLSGVTATLEAIDANTLLNIRIYAGDARQLLAALGPNTLDGVILLFSDPWPKARHQRRRVFSPELLDSLTKVCKTDALFRFASDEQPYVDYVIEIMSNSPDWREILVAEYPQRPPLASWPETRYERKALRRGRPIRYLEYRKNGII